MEKIEKLRNILIDKIKNKEITQTSIAKDTGIDQASINRFYKENRGLSAENTIKLFKYFGLGDEKDEEQIGKENIISRIRDLEARIAEQAARLIDKDEIIALLKKHISMLEGSEGNAFKVEIFQYIGLLAEAAAREGRTLADIVAFHWSDLPRLALEERDVLWMITRSILSKHPEFARARPHAVERAQLPPVPSNKKQLIFSRLDIVQKVIYDLRDTADTLDEPDTA